MVKPPQPGEKDVKSEEDGPIRTAGITPGPTQNPGERDVFPASDEETK